MTISNQLRRNRKWKYVGHCGHRSVIYDFLFDVCRH